MAVKQTEPTGPRPPLANALRTQVTLQLTGGTNRKIANVFHASANGPIAPSVGDLNTYSNAFLTAYANAFKASIGSQYKIIQCDTSMLDRSGVKGSATGSIACTDAGAQLPPQCAAVVSWLTYAYYRGGKPRTYIGGITQTAMNIQGDSQIAAAYATALKTAATNFRNAVNALTIASVGTTLGYVQYFQNYTMLSTPKFWGYVGERVHERIDSQRKRSGRENLFPTV